MFSGSKFLQIIVKLCKHPLYCETVPIFYVIAIMASDSTTAISSTSDSPDTQSHFVMMVKECIDSSVALKLMQAISEGEIATADLLNRIPAGDSEEITRIVQKVTQYTLVEYSDADHTTLKLTESGKEFLSILTDIERLKSRYSG